MDAQPRYEGIDLMISRRVHNREFRLRPCATVNGVVEYVIAIVSAHYSMEINALMAMSTHYHLRAFDPHGRASDFARDCNSFVARMIIRAFGEKDESLWSPAATNYVEDDEPDDPVGQIAYVMSDPVRSGLVKTHTEWPGAKGRWPDPDRTVARPAGFFQKKDTWYPGALTKSGRPRIRWAKNGTLRFTRPRFCDDIVDLEKEIERAIAAREAQAHAKWKGDRRAFPGAEAVMSMSRRARSRGVEPKGDAKRVPSIRILDRSRRIERLLGLRMWKDHYKAAMKAWPTNRDVVFPYGTNKMRVVHNVRVDGPPGGGT